MHFHDKLRRITAAAALAAAMLPAALSASEAQEASPPYTVSGSVLDLRFDQTYYAQIHNTYSHSSRLTNWLDAGYRTVEIDVIDRGDWEDEAKGPYVSHSSGAENSNCGTGNRVNRLGDCLDDIVAWKLSHNIDAPLVVLVDMKSSWDPLNAWNADEVAVLDGWISRYLGNAMFRYTDLRAHLGGGTASDMRALLRTKGWPVNRSLRSQVLVGLTGGKVGAVNQGMAGALDHLGNSPATFLCPDVDAGDPDEISGTIDGIPADKSRMFVCSNIAAGDRFETSLNRAAEYRQMIHVWGQSGDFGNNDYAYNFVAVAQGGSVIGWDNALNLSTSSTSVPAWSNRIPLVGARRGVPGHFEMVNRSSGRCLGVVDPSYGNGKRILDAACTGGDNQKWVYTAEGQLRPKGNNQYCLDINGGSAGAGKAIHLWDCDGGDSEKWFVTPEGQFRSRQNQSYCLDLSGGNAGAWYYTSPCNSSTVWQTFRLRTLADWLPSSY